MTYLTFSPDLLRSARKRAGWSQVTAASALGIARGTVQNTEAGISRPSADHLVAMAVLYGVPVESLYVAHDNHDAAPDATRGAAPFNGKGAATAH